MGTFASRAIDLASCLRPIALIDAGDGPTKVIPADKIVSANSTFSLRKPYPGITASASVCLQISRIASLWCV